jgi:hypothetical protein
MKSKIDSRAFLLVPNMLRRILEGPRLLESGLVLCCTVLYWKLEPGAWSLEAGASTDSKSLILVRFKLHCPLISHVSCKASHGFCLRVQDRKLWHSPALQLDIIPSSVTIAGTN